MAITPARLREHIEGTALALLTDDQVTALANGSEEKAFGPRLGDVWNRTADDAIFLVIAGRFRLLRRDGKTNVLMRFVNPGEIVGFARLGSSRRSSECVADNRARALVMPGGMLASFMNANAAFACAVSQELGRIASDLSDEIVRLRTLTFVERIVARIAVELAGEESGALELTQKDVAELVGGTEADVSKATKAFAKIAFNWESGTLVVKNLAEARELLKLRQRLRP